MFYHGRTSAAILIKAYHVFKDNPETVFKVNDVGGWDESWDLADFRAWFRDCLNDKINRSDARFQAWRKMRADYTNKLGCDRRAIEDYLYRRYRSSGSRGMLRTPEMARRYPHINCQPWED